MVSALTTSPVFATARTDSGIDRFHTLGEPRSQVIGDAFRSVPVPELGDASALAATGEYLLDTASNERPLPADQHVGPLVDRNRTLGVLTHGQARHAQRSRFFLDATRIGDDQGCLLDEPQRLEIALRRQR